jgi:Ca2+-binding RTX toxin-like protein
MKKELLAGTIGVGIALLAPGSALGSSATINNGNTVRVTETGNETNRIGITYAAGPDVYTVADSASNITASGICTAVDSHTVTCKGTGIKTVSVSTDDRDDTIVLDRQTIPTAVVGTLDAGSGNDTVAGSNGPCTLTGSSGNDFLLGGKGADDLNGGSGTDAMNGGDGGDDIEGGSGTDTVGYPPERTTPIAVTVGTGNDNDGGAQDQTGGGRDTIHGDVEAVIGTAASDILIGDNSSETLNGMAGDDLLIGNGGSDALNGFEGNDVVSGGDGNDTARGSFGNDQMGGGSGNDRLAGGPDNDFLSGKKGNDVMKGKTGVDGIRAKDGFRDVKISCGPGPNGLEGATRDKRLDPRPKSC